jgi:hypothetical protein
MFYFLILSLGMGMGVGMFGERPQVNKMVNCAGVDTCKTTGGGDHATNVRCTQFGPCNQPMRDLR